MFEFEYILMEMLVIIDIVVIVFVTREILELKRVSRLIQTNIDTTKKSVEKIVSSARLLQRDQIYYWLSQTAREAKKYVYHLSFTHSSVETSDKKEKERVENFLDSLQTASRKGVDVRVLGPKIQQKVGGLWERKKCGCNVKVSSSMPDYDLRMQLIDDEKAVIGTGSPKETSLDGFLITSRKLTKLLKREFENLWNKAEPLDDYIIYEVPRMFSVIEMDFQRFLNMIVSTFHIESNEVAQEIIKMLLNKKFFLRLSNNKIVDVFLIYMQWKPNSPQEIQDKLEVSDTDAQRIFNTIEEKKEEFQQKLKEMKGVQEK